MNFIYGMSIAIYAIAALATIVHVVFFSIYKYQQYEIRMNDMPIEILMKILSYLPDNKAAALVNHRFYDAVCTLDAPILRLGVFVNHLPNDKKQDYLESIMKTRRIIRNIMVSFAAEERSVVIGVLKKFSKNIDYLRVCGWHASDLVEAVKLVPNAVHLELILLSNGHDDDEDDDVPLPKKARQDENQEELTLLRLRKLKIERCQHQFLDMFNRLPGNVLNEITLHQQSLCRLANLFWTQTNIKKLTIFNDEYSYKDPIIDANLFDTLQLEFLEWHAHSFKHIGSILPKQINLKVLNLIGGKIGVDLFNVITNQLKKLETLSITVSHIPIHDIRSITKLINLKEITLQSENEHSVEQFKEFSALDNSRITILNIQHRYKISNDLINAIAKSMPNLKSVSFHCDYNINTFHEILKNFNYVEVLQLDTRNIAFENYDRKGNYTTLMKQGCENDSLAELKILYPMSYTVKIINKIDMDYPHLKRLIILPKNRDFTEQFKAILAGFKEMESLFILRDSLSLDRRYYCLHSTVKYGVNLKFLALLDMECSELHIEENVKEKFGVIKYSRTDGLRMAVDRKTMKTEEKYIQHCNK